MTTVLVISLLGVLLLVEVVRIGWYFMLSQKIRNATAAFSAHKPEASTKILVIGDSTAYGVGASSPQKSLPGLLANDFPKAHIENWSVCAANLLWLETLLKEKSEVAKKPQFDVVFLQLGGMDIVSFTSLSTIAQSLQTSIKMAKSIGSRVILVIPNNPGLAPIFRFPLAQLYEARGKKVHGLFSRLAEEHKITAVSLFREGSDVLSAGKGSYHAVDRSHPNDTGYELWYQQIREVTYEIFPKA